MVGIFLVGGAGASLGGRERVADRATARGRARQWMRYMVGWTEVMPRAFASERRLARCRGSASSAA
nr:hypothetical protein [Gammaproteobacteria bacterium]